jgi:hypothetical protein
MIAWRESLDGHIQTINVDSDRICAIQLANASNSTKSNLYIIGVYLPHQRCQISNFQLHLNKLETLVQQCQKDGEVVIIGDTNCHFGTEVGPRYSGKTTYNAKQFLKMTSRNDLHIADRCAPCTGPSYTFFVEGVGESYVDHVIISSPLVALVEDCKVMEDTVDNTSDHLSISIQLQLDNLPCNNCITPTGGVKWSKYSTDELQDKYTNPLNIAFSKLYPDIEEKTILSVNYVTMIINSITSILSEHSKPLK